ncbi:hypothetical protein [Nocardia abscessus]|uniref:hypothetical protein n=1 Tax=Nocardia abscessus TaxID=120957 RepID=UPI002457177A|nr:hypothetical protein [Nocardia abscessus]
MKMTLRATCAAAAVVGAIIGSAPSVVAQPPPPTDQGTPEDVQGVLNRLSQTQTLTESDRAILLKYPDIAEQIVDPGKVVLGTEQKQPADQTKVGPGCWTWARDVKGYTVLGQDAYTVRFRADWCEDEANIRGVHFRSQEVTFLGTFMNDRGEKENFVTPTPYPNVEVKLKREIENCVPIYGCVNSDYPYARFDLHAGPNNEDFFYTGVQ